MSNKQKPKEGPSSPHVPLRVVSETASAVLATTGDGTVVMRGQTRSPGALTYVCGSCGAPLLEDLRPEQVDGLAVRCNRCQALNEKVHLPQPRGR